MHAIALDFDGTLISPRNKHIQLMIAICKSHGIYLSNEQINYLWDEKRSGSNNAHALRKLHVAEDILVRVCRTWVELVETKYWSDYDKLYEQSLDFLHKSSKNYNLYLITARSNRITLEQQLNRFGINGFFQNYYVVDPKFASEEKSKILKKLKPSFFIGDTESDFKAALSSDVEFIGLDTGMRDELFLKKCGVENIFSDLNKVFEYIKVVN